MWDGSDWVPAPQAEAPASALPAGWITGVDEATGAAYYYNELTGTAQWEPPQQAASAQQIMEHDVYDPRSVTQSYDQYLAEPPAGQ